MAKLGLIRKTFIIILKLSFYLYRIYLNNQYYTYVWEWVKKVTFFIFILFVWDVFSFFYNSQSQGPQIQRELQEKIFLYCIRQD